MSNRRGLSQRDTRNALFGTSNGSSYDSYSPASSSHSYLPKKKSRESSPLPMHHNPGGYAASRTAEDLETQNEEHLSGLRGQVQLLKQITIGIGNEVKESTKMLQGMNDTFETTGGFLGNTVKKMNKMAKRQGGQFCWWMLFLLIVTGVFFWTWVWRR